MKLHGLEHSCFKMESNGYTVILDPYEDDYVPDLRRCGRPQTRYSAVTSIKIIMQERL